MANETNTETVEQKRYVLHELQAQHLFLLTRVIAKLDLKSIANIFAGKVDVEKLEGEDAVRAVGYDTVFEIVGLVIEKLPDCQNDLFKFLAAISNLNEKQVAALPLNQFVEMVSDVVRKDEFADFFTACAKFLQ